MSNDEEFPKHGLSEELKKLLASMSPKEIKVLREKFGIDFANLSQVQVAQQFIATRQRIREVEQKALEKLRGGKGPDDAA